MRWRRAHKRALCGHCLPGYVLSLRDCICCAPFRRSWRFRSINRGAWKFHKADNNCDIIGRSFRTLIKVRVLRLKDIFPRIRVSTESTRCPSVLTNFYFLNFLWNFTQKMKQSRNYSSWSDFSFIWMNSSVEVGVSIFMK